MPEHAFDAGHNPKTHLHVEYLGVPLVLRHETENPFYSQLVEWIVETDKDHIAVDPVLIERTGMSDDRFAGKLGVHHPTEERAVPHPTNVAGVGRVVMSARELGDGIAMLRVVKNDLIQYLVAPVPV